MKKNNSYNILILSILASFLILLNSCSSRGKIWDPADAREFPAEPEKRVQKNLEEGRGFRIMDLNKKEGGGSFEFATSNALWRATLDILDFMALEKIDPFGGIIMTKWFINENNDNIRNKITISFSNSELKATSIKVSVTREKFKNDNWIADGHSDGLARKIEDLILRRARELRNSSN